MKFNLPKATGPTPAAQRGMALVITLIMLSVTLVMAIAFLAVSNRERVSVTTSTDQANARLATESALAAAQSQILANVLGSGGGTYNFGLIVSTNYINAYGFVAGSTSPTNVNFDYRAVPSQSALLSGDFEQDVANLLYLPRVPVLVSSNEPNGRFYLDLNRNGVFDDTGGSSTNAPLSPTMFYVDAFGNTNSSLANVQTGDPQWIGALERPDVVHSPDNKFVYRYAFIAVPVGNGLDLNYIHNQVLNQNLNSQDGYFRNQGVGSWELNLAAFLTDLNTNQWDTSIDPYLYAQPFSGNRGAGFEDAFSLLSWRYNFNYATLASANALFANANIFRADNVDEYGDGPLQVTTTNIDESFVANQDAPNKSWAGSDSTNRFFNLPSELFDPTKSSTAFVNRLTAAGTTLANGAHPTYDRYTYYRMLQELGTDSDPDDTGKLDLNYDNTDGNGHVLPNAQTNLIPWTALAFFTNAADRMLRMYTTNWFQSSPSNYLATYFGTNFNYSYTYQNSGGNNITVIDDPNGFGLTNFPFFGATNQIPTFGISGIPVYVNSTFVYSPAVNRVLQLAANIYDASTNSFYPSVFRPLFSKDAFGNIFITGYANVGALSNGVSDIIFSTPFDVTMIAALPGVFTNVADNIYGVPWIIGAKKGFPNFNEFSMENSLAVTRRLQLTRQINPGAPPTITGTNQMYTMSLNSALGAEFWNAYSGNYPNPVFVDVIDNATLAITNYDNTPNLLYQKTVSNNIIIPVPSWQGAGASPWTAGNPNSLSFVFTNFLGPVLTNSVYRSPFANGNFAYTLGLSAPGFIPTNYFVTPEALLFETNSPNGFYFPQFVVQITNRLQVFMLDVSNGLYHVIDYAHFGGPNSSFNVNSNLADPDPVNGNVGVWNTNYPPNSSPPYGPTYGILNQITYSLNGNARGQNDDGAWAGDPTLPGSLQYQEAFFQAFFKPNNTTQFPTYASNGELSVQAPYSPTRYIVQYTTWQANDPLVHYLASDINFTTSTNSSRPAPGVNHYNSAQGLLGLTSLNLGLLNDHYTPWSGNPHLLLSQQISDPNRFSMGERDPLMMWPDNWDFPNNRYPTVGWLGRVHRGTPWQTVYLKATNILSSVNGLGVWQAWTGDGSSFDANNSAPVQDTRLFDIFTTALDDNASRGTLSVNQPNLAAWSALFSSMVVLTNVTPNIDNFSPQPTNGFMVINPGGVDTSSPVWQMVEGTNGIIATRGNTAIFANGAFTHIGDIVRVPALTQQSPFINISDASHQEYDVKDEVYEQIPQQIMGLLRIGSPRYVVYCYGQALRPAQDGTALDLAHNGLVTNYQVVAESAARAVVAVHPQVVYRPPNQPVTNYTTTVENFNLLPPD